MSVQINCCPVKGRARSLAPSPAGTLWPVSGCLPAQSGQSLSSAVPQTVPGHCLEEHWLAKIMLGTIPAACRMGGCVPETGFASHRFADVSVLYLGRAGSASQVQAVAPFPTCVPSGWIVRYLDLPFQRLWDELGSSYGLEEVLQFFCSSVQCQEEAPSGPELLPPLSSASLCNIKAEIIPAVLQKDQKNLKALLAQAS